MKFHSVCTIIFLNQLSSEKCCTCLVLVYITREYITYINSCLTHKCKLNINKQNESKIIQIHTKLLPCINFDVCKNDKNILKQSGYDETILHIDKFELLKK